MRLRLLGVLVLGGCIEQNPGWLEPTSEGPGTSESSTATTGTTTESSTTSTESSGSTSTSDSGSTTAVGSESGTGSSTTTLEGSSGSSDSGGLDMHRMFISSTVVTGAFGGLAGGDTICADLATAAMLDGTWVALLSDSLTAARDRIVIGGPVLDMMGNEMAVDEADLWDSMLTVAPVYDELGNEVQGKQTWTGCEPDGTIDDTCGDWTLEGNQDVGMTGSSAWSDYRWISWGIDSCSKDLRLYCIDQ